MQKFDIGIAWEWEFDVDFVNSLHDTLEKRGFSCYLINQHNLHETWERIKNKDLFFKIFIDRASDVDEYFIPMAEFFSSHKKTFAVNKYNDSVRARDKAILHLEFLQAGIHVPHTEILPPFHEHAFLPEEILHAFKKPFIVKPANGGGGEHVYVSSENLHDVSCARQACVDDKFLIQEKIHPVNYNRKRAWFRVFYILGKAIPCWWDDRTRLYKIMDIEDEREFKLGRLRKITRKIAEISRLNFFSTEICVTKDRDFVCIDYVNDPCDMRTDVNDHDGVPDSIVERMIKQIGLILKKHV